MKKLLVLALFLCTGVIFAQDLPSNPEPGKCYVRCKTPDVYENKEVTIEVAPAYNKISIVPTKYAKETVEVVVNEGGQRLEVIPAVYENKDFVITIKEASTRLEVVPAVYETKTETIMVKEASHRLVAVPAVYGSEVVTYKKREYGNTLRVSKATFGSDVEVLEVKPASAKWEMGDRAPDCASADPNDCRYWCYKEIPAVYKTVNKTTLLNNASVSSTPDCEDGSGAKNNCGESSYKKIVMVTPPTTKVVEIPEVTKVIKRTVLVSAPTTRVIEIPAVTKTYTKRVMVTAPTTRVIDTPKKMGSVVKTVVASAAVSNQTSVEAKYQTISKEILVSKGGLTEWKEVECKLLEYNDLGIKWNLGSATLTAEAKAIINAKLLPVLQQNSGSKVEVASHTDARGTKTNNQVLSERRAQAVSNYLITKGINASRLVSNGYGESRLTNRCADGVSCTEREHKNNRRTEFRIIDAGE